MLSMANPENGQVPKVQRGGEGECSFRTMGAMLKASESYRLGVASTTGSPQNEWADYRTGIGALCGRCVNLPDCG
jgi:hypothetical protein